MTDIIAGLVQRAERKRKLVQYELDMACTGHQASVVTAWVPFMDLQGTMLRMNAKFEGAQNQTVHIVRHLAPNGVRQYRYLSQVVTYATEGWRLELMTMRNTDPDHVNESGLAVPFGKAEPLDIISVGYEVKDLERELERCRDNPDMFLGKYRFEDGVLDYDCAYVGTQGDHPYLNPRQELK